MTDADLQQFKQKAVAIASGMGMGLEPGKSQSKCYLVNGEEKLMLDLDWHGRRISISGIGFPRLRGGRRVKGSSCEISVSAKREPVDIVREITRRLMPVYLDSLAAARREADSIDAVMKPALDLLSRTAERLGAEEMNSSLRVDLEDSGNLSVEVDEEGLCSIELTSVPVKVAEKLLATLTLPTVSIKIKEPS